MSETHMRAAFDFAVEVATALTLAKVKGSGDASQSGPCRAVLIVYAPSPRHEPIGFSLNFSEESGTWEASVDMVHASPVSEERQ